MAASCAKSSNNQGDTIEISWEFRIYDIDSNDLTLPDGKYPLGSIQVQVGNDLKPLSAFSSRWGGSYRFLFHNYFIEKGRIEYQTPTDGLPFYIIYNENETDTIMYDFQVIDNQFLPYLYLNGELIGTKDNLVAKREWKMPIFK
jgi:hypothetical protein